MRSIGREGQEDAEDFFTWFNECLEGPLIKKTAQVNLIEDNESKSIGKTVSCNVTSETVLRLSLSNLVGKEHAADKMTLEYLLNEFMSNNPIEMLIDGDEVEALQT